MLFQGKLLSGLTLDEAEQRVADFYKTQPQHASRPPRHASFAPRATALHETDPARVTAVKAVQCNYESAWGVDLSLIHI